MTERWICEACSIIKPCFMDASKGNIPFRCPLTGGQVPQWKRAKTEPQPAPQPVLMTGYEAVRACSNGGEIWHHLDGFRISFDADGNLLKWNGGVDLCAKYYTVRPLPPAYFGFDEALECLKRGEEFIDEDGKIYMPRATFRYYDTDRGNFTTNLDNLKDKRFRKA